METREKGNLTEAKIMAALIEAGYLVSLPFGDGHKLATDINTALLLMTVIRFKEFSARQEELEAVG